MGGFTLTELIATVAIMVTGTTVVIPGAVDMVRNNRQTAVINDYSHSLFITRSEAVSRAIGVSLCPSDNGSSCLSGTEWQAGWIAFTDKNLNGSKDSDDELLRVFPGIGGDTRISAASTVTYSPMGIVKTGSGVITVCDQRGQSAAKGLQLIASGFVHVLSDSDDDGIVDDGSADADNLECA